MTAPTPQPRAILQRLAHKAMCDRGLLPDFSAAALAEVARIEVPVPGKDTIRDLRNLLRSLRSTERDFSDDGSVMHAGAAISKPLVREPLPEAVEAK